MMHLLGCLHKFGENKFGTNCSTSLQSESSHRSNKRVPMKSFNNYKVEISSCKGRCQTRCLVKCRLCEIVQQSGEEVSAYQYWYIWLYLRIFQWYLVVLRRTFKYIWLYLVMFGCIFLYLVVFWNCRLCKIVQQSGEEVSAMSQL